MQNNKKLSKFHSERELDDPKDVAALARRPNAVAVGSRMNRPTRAVTITITFTLGSLKFFAPTSSAAPTFRNPVPTPIASRIARSWPPKSQPTNADRTTNTSPAKIAPVPNSFSTLCKLNTTISTNTTSPLTLAMSPSDESNQAGNERNFAWTANPMKRGRSMSRKERLRERATSGVAGVL